MRFESFEFGSIRIDGTTYEHDVVIDRGEVRKREKKPSKKFRGDFGHTPLSIEEKIPWQCRRLVIGTGTGALPVMDQDPRFGADDERRRRPQARLDEEPDPLDVDDDGCRRLLEDLAGELVVHASPRAKSS